jgi:hypothetical protein
MSPDLKPLPEIATYHFQPENAERFAFALSDVLCWLDGFKAGGGVYSPGSTEDLRDLNRACKDMFPGGTTSTKSHL